jgi:hypothetical protein
MAVGMVVIAMLVVVTMVVAVTLTCMIMRIARLVGVTGVSAAFRIEWRLDLDGPRAQPLYHRLDDVIAPDTQAPRRYLRRQVTVAKMPGDPNQGLRIAAPDFHERLWRGHDLDQPAILEHQRVTAPQRDRVFEIEQKRKPPRARHGHSPPMPIVEIKHDRIGRRINPAMLPANLCGTDHWNPPRE